MKLGWGSRQVLALLLLSIVLVGSSGLFEISNVLRMATERAATEGGYVTDAVQRLIIFLNRESPEAPLAELAQDPQVEQVLASGLAHAPSVGTIVICEPNGIAVAHAIPENLGEFIPRLPELPRPTGFRDALALLGDLREHRQSYEVSTDLAQGEVAFGSIRAHISGTLLWDEVRRVLLRSIATAAIVIVLAVVLGILLGRLAARPVRMLERSVVAMREGRSEPIPEKGVELFGHLARELNMLRDRVQMEPRVLESVGQLATGMAHEIQQPIQAIKFALDALRDARELPGQEVESYVHSAKVAVDRMNNSVNGFLTVVRLKPMDVGPIDTNQILEEIKEIQEIDANLAGLELDLDLDPNVVETYADGQVLRQAVENLVKNAIQATPSREGRIELGSRFEPDGIRITVRDTGPGIPEELQQKIFNFSFTTKERGTGVGLALVRQAVEIHGGEVSIDTEVGSGTTMTLFLPLRTAMVSSARG